jgi:hypothetical protein
VISRISEQIPACHFDCEKDECDGKKKQIPISDFELRRSYDKKWEENQEYDIYLSPKEDKYEQG